ncbi:hypothetical protein [Laspinema olomoucense]|uniref:hypothetical protein n=1 Tax=Laspinema olomoucense TaxID=3231600 RepID=UPI0021BAB209|nr:hypothetical protein [Laspinema sp. D3d]MCT7975241.1 hypothetical protein [Laspinema sp. D3d]
MQSTQQIRFSPVDLMERYEIKKDAYYARLKFLQIKANKDPDTNQAYLEQPEVDLLDHLHDWINQTGSMSGFEVEPQAEAGELAVSNGNGQVAQQQNYDNAQEIAAAVNAQRTDRQTLRKFDRSAQTSAAAALVEARNILAADYIAHPDQLDEDLQQEVFFEEKPEVINRAWAAKNLAAAIKAQKRNGF